MPEALLLTHPATAEMAYRMACDLRDAAYTTEDPLGRLITVLTEAYTRIIADLSRPESRDAWVRWLIARDTEHAEEMVTVSQDAGGSFEAYYIPTGRLLAVGDTEREAVSVARTMIAVGHHRANLRNNPTALLAAIQGVSRG